MKIQEAIEILERRTKSPFVKANTPSLEATQLGIEALKRVKRNRGFNPTEIHKLLPGETEE